MLQVFYTSLLLTQCNNKLLVCVEQCCLFGLVTHVGYMWYPLYLNNKGCYTMMIHNFGDTEMKHSYKVTVHAPCGAYEYYIPQVNLL